jgi:hypothetical protein
MCGRGLGFRVLRFRGYVFDPKRRRPSIGLGCPRDGGLGLGFKLSLHTVIPL